MQMIELNGLKITEEDSNREVLGSIPARDGNFCCHCILDECSRITSYIARSRGLLYVNIKTPRYVSGLIKTAKSDGWTLKNTIID